MRKLLPALVVASILSFSAQAQDQRPMPNRPVFSIVDQPPQFPGGTGKLTDYIKKNLHYPKVAKRAKLEGQVLVNFVVTDQGRIEDIKLFNSLGLGTDEEAMRLVKDMPDWEPGKKAGQPVNVRCNLPINFTLD